MAILKSDPQVEAKEDWRRGLKLMINNAIAFLAAAAIAWLLVLLPAIGAGNARIVSVHDGDTVKVLHSGKTFNIRLRGIDANEIKQEGGIQSRDYLRSLLPVGSKVKIELDNTKSYNRVVGFIYHNGTDINLKMVATGNAIAEISYLPKHLKAQYKNAESTAIKKKLGRWKHPTWQQKPSEFRHK